MQRKKTVLERIQKFQKHNFTCGLLFENRFCDMLASNSPINWVNKICEASRHSSHGCSLRLNHGTTSSSSIAAPAAAATAAQRHPPPTISTQTTTPAAIEATAIEAIAIAPYLILFCEISRRKIPHDISFRGTATPIFTCLTCLTCLTCCHCRHKC